MLTAYKKFRAKTLAFAEAARPEGRRCWLFHRWAPWNDVRSYELSVTDGVIGHGVEQHRRCDRCNALAVRRVQYTIFE